MPSIDVAMARSLQEAGPWDRLRQSVARSIVVTLQDRDVISDAKDSVNDVQTALSSWDNCMAANFCKYPAIAIMVVGGLIILAIVTCIVRCACCAKSCCCSCFSCLKCCGNCCGCCDPPGSNKKHQYLDEPYIPPNQGYRTEAPMHATFPMSSGVTGPQYAEFDTPKRGGEDSLPQMPSWEGANSKKVELEEEAVEMNNLPKSPSEKAEQIPASGPTTPGVASAVPMDNGRAGPYGHSTPTQSAMGLGNSPHVVDPYGRQQQMPPQQQQSTDGYGLDQPYDQPYDAPTPPVAPMGAMGAVPGGRNSPGPGRNPYAQPHNPYGSNSPMDQGAVEMPAGPSEYGPRDPYRQAPSPGPGAMGAPAGYGMRRQPTGEDMYGQRVASPGPGYRGYGPGPRMNSPGPNGPGPRMNSPGPNGRVPYGMDPRMRNSPGPRSPRMPRPGPGSPANHPGGGYGSPMASPSRENFNRSYSPGPGPDRQYAQSPRPLAATQSPLSQLHDSPSSPIVNNGGFDFTSGFSRPQTSEGSQYEGRPAAEPRELPAEEPYPGYRAYRPS